jgi:hypothetical protein
LVVSLGKSKSSTLCHHEVVSFGGFFENKENIFICVNLNNNEAGGVVIRRLKKALPVQKREPND